MKQKSFANLAGLILLSTTTLTACATQQTNKNSTEYNYVYTTDPQTLDYVVSNRSTTGDVVGNLIDGLLEYDKYGNLIPSLAKEWTVSEDGLTYTYKLRDDAKWYTADGEEYADVTAQDFVTGLKHAADAKSEALYLVQDSISGLTDYLNGNSTDFNTVGVKALDDYTVQYTLTRPESYWNSKTTMGVLFPVNADFLNSKGDKFGSVDLNGLLYNGPYILSSLTSKSSIEYTKNPSYYDADNVHIESVNLSYYDGSNPESLVKGFVDGTYSMARLYPTTASYSSISDKYKDNIVYSPQDGTTYWANFNINRQNFEHTSKTTDVQKQSTIKALQNKDFRQALTFGLDRIAYLAQSLGEEGAKSALRNSVTPPTFVQIGNDSFGKAVEEKLVSYGSEWANVSLEDAQDSFYNIEKAKEELTKAKESLIAEGVEFPIHLDLPIDKTSEISLQAVQSFKQSIESNLGSENVIIDIQQLDTDTYDSITYYAANAGQNDYDISVASGWGPDYNDPSTYLDIFSPTTGASVEKLGIDPGKNADIAKVAGLDTYEELLKKAGNETADLTARYTAYAEAQAWLTDSALVIPIQSGGATPTLRYTTPFSSGFSWAGIKGQKNYKYLTIQDNIVTTTDYDKAYKEWLEEKEKSNAESQKALSEHVEK